jgi:DNA-binding NarL/FixJ family response regulator
MSPQEQFRHIAVGVFCPDRQLAQLLSMCLRGASPSEINTVFDPLEPSFARSVRQSDVGVVPLNAWGLEAIRRLRRDPVSPNRYIPLVALGIDPKLPDLRAAIDAGAHDVLTLPASAEALRGRIVRAVIAGRPFIETETYFGPCRRRNLKPDHKGPERRRDPLGDLATRASTEARVDIMLDI